MSKSDDMRAMREARYAAATTRPTLRAVPTDGVEPGATGAPDQPAKATRPARGTRRPLEPAPAVVEEPAAGLCGHRAISGRTCTREAGHAAKSHRYA